jgi:hypothetical protein
VESIAVTVPNSARSFAAKQIPCASRLEESS